VRQFLAWLVILGVVAFIVYRNTRFAEPVDDAVLRIATTRLRVFILMETASLQKQFGATGEKRLADQTSTAFRLIEEEAVTPEDRFRAAVGAGEILGKDRAAADLERLSPLADGELTVDIRLAETIYAEGPNKLSPEDRARLIRRHGDFGKLALAFGVPKNEEPRKSIERTAERSFAIVGVAVAGMLLLALSSIACCIALAVLLIQQKLHRARVAQDVPGSVLVEAFAIYLLLFMSFGSILRLFGFQSIGWNWLVGVLVAALLYWIRKSDGAWQSLGLHRGRGWSREIAAGLMGYLAGFVIIVPGILITYVLAQHAGVRVGHPIMAPLLSGGPLEIAGLYGLACVLAPVTEEIMFRGVLFGHLRSRWNWFISAGIVSLIFAILHPQGWLAVPALGAIALVLAAIREWRDSLIASTAAHAFNNFIAITLAVLLLRMT
jgi:membrane protease YdiL (CAAX protease family)